MNNAGKRIAKLFLMSAFAVASLVFAMVLGGKASKESVEVIAIYSAISFFAFSVDTFFKFFFLNEIPYRKKFIIQALAYLSLIIPSLCILVNADISYKVIGIALASFIAIDHIITIKRDFSTRNLVYNGFMVLLAGYAIVYFSFPQLASDKATYPMVYGTIVAFFSLVDLLICVFKGFNIQLLTKIIKKTYAVEILYGLLTLIVGTSILLFLFEPEEFPTFGDSLWYCFAVVTTIGFGDFASTTFIGRMLTVALGLYGLVVVALLTSIIVNFYIEMSPEDEEKRARLKKKVTKSTKEKKTTKK